MKCLSIFILKLSNNIVKQSHQIPEYVTRPEYEFAHDAFLASTLASSTVLYMPQNLVFEPHKTELK
jgi:hypothetical protein